MILPLSSHKSKKTLNPVDGICVRINVAQTGLYNKAYNGQYTVGKICPSIPWKIKKT